MTKHLGIFTRENVEKILSGRKRADGRFSKIRVSPYLDVSAGDVVYIKEAGEGIVGQFFVSKVIYYDHPDGSDLEVIKKKYSRVMSFDDEFWRRLERVNYVSIIFIERVSRFLVPPMIDKKDSRGWVKLN